MKAYNICCAWLSTKSPLSFANFKDFSLNICHFSETSTSFTSHLDSSRGKGPSCSPATSLIMTGESSGKIPAAERAKSNSSPSASSVSSSDERMSAVCRCDEGRKIGEGVESLFVGEELSV